MKPVLIAGGGIAGLASAIALAAKGIPSHVLERRSSFSEDGAGIQLSPNGLGVLRRLGVAGRLERFAGRPESINVYNAVSGRRLASLSLGSSMAGRFGAPYWVAHRRDLQAALLDAAKASKLIEITNGFELRGLMETGKSICVMSGEAEEARGAALIGADGMWSKLRDLLFPHAALTFSGKSAARAVVPASTAAPPFCDNATGVWLAPHCHVVHYPLRGGSELAVIAVVDEERQSEGWGAAADNDRLMDSLSGLAPVLRRFLEFIPCWRQWSLYELPALPSWSRGRCGLIGDAAHPVLPFLAQGGAMALEDAETLSALLASCRPDFDAAFAAFERARRARVARVLAASKRNGGIYHMRGPLAWVRDLTLRLAPPAYVMRRYDWLYRWPGQDGA